VRDVSKLKEFVEGRQVPESEESGPVAQNDDFEILKESPLMGDGKFKLEIGIADFQNPPLRHIEWISFSSHAACGE
jgi:hypothetical protein